MIVPNEGVCYALERRLDDDVGTEAAIDALLPVLHVELEGVVLSLPPSQYMWEDTESRGTWCLGVYMNNHGTQLYAHYLITLTEAH